MSADELSVQQIVNKLTIGETIILQFPNRESAAYFRNRVATVKSRQEAQLKSIMDVELDTLRSSMKKNKSGVELTLWFGPRKEVAKFTVTILPANTEEAT